MLEARAEIVARINEILETLRMVSKLDNMEKLDVSKLLKEYDMLMLVIGS
jgi:hypothetical protein